MKQLLIFVACLVGLSGTRLLGQDLVWVKQTGGANSEQSGAIVTDAVGNTITTGIFGGIVDFDPGVGVYNLNSATGGGNYLLKLDPNGDFISALQFGGRVWGMKTDLNGNFLLAGEFSGTPDFDPGNGVANLTSAGASDIFLLKLDPNGNFVFVKQMGGPSNDRAYNIAIDPNGNILITGEYYGMADFDPGNGTFILTPNGINDIFVSKLDASGNLIWARSLGGSSGDRGYGVFCDSQAQIYITGYFSEIVDFDPNSGIYNLSASGTMGYEDVFILKLNSSGDYIWANSFGSPTADDEGRDLLVDNQGVLQIAGSVNGTVDFDPGNGTFQLTGTGFITEFDAASGNFISAFCFPEGNVIVHTFTLDAAGNKYVGGNFSSNGLIDFDPGPGVTQMQSLGINDVFIAKIGIQSNLIWAAKVGSTLNDLNWGIVLHDRYVYTTGSFRNVCDFDPGSGTFNVTTAGLEDAFVLKLTRCNHSNTTIFPIVCDGYTTPSGQVLTTSGTYQDTIPNIGGCDSVITINLTIGNSSATISPISCTGSYLSPSGNDVWTVSGTYLDTLSTVNGCDSVITVNLTVNSVNATATANGNVLSATVSGATYQWLDCNGMTIIAGETGQSFSPIVSGSYAVAVTENGCTDTSACFSVTIIGIDPDIQSTTIAVYPNPSEGIFHVLGTDLQSVLIFNALGQTVFAEKPNQGVIDLSFLPKGMYWLRAQSGEGLSLPTTICIE